MQSHSSSNSGSQDRLMRMAAERVVIEEVWPEIDGGRHPIKRVVGDVLEVWADIFCDGHEVLAACICYREAHGRTWREAPMQSLDNDRWRGTFTADRNTRYVYTIEAWRDRFATWREDFLKKSEAGQDIALELLEGRELVLEAVEQYNANLSSFRPLIRSPSGAGRATPEPESNSSTSKSKMDPGLRRDDGLGFSEVVRRLNGAGDDQTALESVLLDNDLPGLMRMHGPRTNAARYRHELEVIVDRPAARFGAWYEMFPRSASNDARRHGTFDDAIARLPYVRELGFDVLYLPPIHPIGAGHRKGRNNALEAASDDPGSPWAIGSDDGGHTAIHSELGTLEDFRRLVSAAREQGIEIALDFAIQCSRDHPWIKEHPEWFDWRPDGTIKYAENPPKKYQDIVNVHFYRDALPSLWLALRDVVWFWIDLGVRIFRVDNPHTKPVPFWEWLIRDIQDRDPEVIFLAEAFTRPKMMRKLAKAGFTQSYTYFTWRNTKAELTEYLTELAQDVPKEYMRPNFFVNTPDINPPILQTGGRAAFQTRAALAATLSSAWGIYSGFELCESVAIPGREEYMDSEKYQLKVRDFDAPGNIRDFIARLNRVRRENPALHEVTNLRFHPSNDDNILFYGKTTTDGSNAVWIAVNLDPYQAHEANIELPLYTLDLDDYASVEVEDLLKDHRFQWHAKWQRLRLDPQVNPCAIWRVSRT